jgi:DNA-binding transcriptional LysR family regulator
MDLHQLEHFLAVVDERTFTRAAERLSRTQPAVSNSIKKLEDELGTPLFARDLPEVSLTDAGKTLLEHARRMLRTRDEALRELTALKDLRSGALTIAAHESAAVYLLPDALRVYVARFPDIRVGIYRSRLAEIPRQVMDREVQVGFVKEDPGFYELSCVEVHSDQMVVVASPHHHLATRESIEIRDLANEPIVLHHLCNRTQQVVSRAFRQHNTPCRIVAELWSFENIKSFVQHDVGIAYVPRVTVAEELRDGRLVRLPTPALEMPRGTLMIYRDQGYLADAARALIALVRDFNWPCDADAYDAGRTLRTPPALSPSRRTIGSTSPTGVRASARTRRPPRGPGEAAPLAS